MQMLKMDERQGVLQELQIVILQTGPLAVGGLLYTWIGVHGTRIDADGRPDVYANRVLSYCERDGWIEDPALIIKLLDKIAPIAVGPYAAQIPTVAVRLRNNGPDVTNFFRNSTVWQTCHLSLALPFLNREITRVALEQFFNPLELSGQAARVLIVNGPPGSGKSFTGDFLRLLIGLRSATNAVAEADFSVLKSQSLTPDLLAIHLAKQMGVDEARAIADMKRLLTPRPERWAKAIAIWLAAESDRTQKTWHLFLDNFHLPGVPEATHIFIDLLLAALTDQQSVAWNVRDTVMGPPLRLVLSGYTRNTPENNPLLRVEEIKPITLEHLRLHFQRYFAYKDWPLNATEIDAIVARYVPHLSSLFPVATGPTTATNGTVTQPPWKMRELKDVVLLDCEVLERQRGGPPVAPVVGGTPPAEGGNE